MRHALDQIRTPPVKPVNHTHGPDVGPQPSNLTPQLISVVLHIEQAQRGRAMPRTCMEGHLFAAYDLTAVI